MNNPFKRISLSEETKETLYKIGAAVLISGLFLAALAMFSAFAAHTLFSGVAVGIAAALLAGFETYQWLDNQSKPGKRLFTEDFLTASDAILEKITDWLQKQFAKEQPWPKKIGLGIALVLTAPISALIGLHAMIAIQAAFLLHIFLEILQAMAGSPHRAIRVVPKLVAGLSGAAIAALIVAAATSFVAPGLAVAAMPLLITAVSLLTAFSMKEITSAVMKAWQQYHTSSTVSEDKHLSAFQKASVITRVALALSLAAVGIALAVSPAAPLLLTAGVLLTVILATRIVNRKLNEPNSASKGANPNEGIKPGDPGFDYGAHAQRITQNLETLKKHVQQVEATQGRKNATSSSDLFSQPTQKPEAQQPAASGPTNEF